MDGKDETLFDCDDVNRTFGGDSFGSGSEDVFAFVFL